MSVHLPLHLNLLHGSISFTCLLGVSRLLTYIIFSDNVVDNSKDLPHPPKLAVLHIHHPDLHQCAANLSVHVHIQYSPALCSVELLVKVPNCALAVQHMAHTICLLFSSQQLHSVCLQLYTQSNIHLRSKSTCPKYVCNRTTCAWCPTTAQFPFKNRSLPSITITCARCGQITAL
jgi:hypothetical protein